MTTKFDIKQTVWFMKENEPKKGTVHKVLIFFDKSIKYQIRRGEDDYGRYEDELSTSKEGLRKIIFGE
jgi:hypothetical protein